VEVAGRKLRIHVVIIDKRLHGSCICHDSVGRNPREHLPDIGKERLIGGATPTSISAALSPDTECGHLQ
jgi:hypothetical protein